MRTSEGFCGRTALVTGAAGGMGLEVCRRLGAEGVRVYGVDVQAPDSGESLDDAVFETGDAGDEGLMSALAGAGRSKRPVGSTTWSTRPACSGSVATRR